MKIWILTACAVMLLLDVRPAYAYIDPGSGSLIYQTILMMILGLGFVMRRARGSIARFARRIVGKRDEAMERLPPRRS